jgi:hypothetical protein
MLKNGALKKVRKQDRKGWIAVNRIKGKVQDRKVKIRNVRLEVQEPKKAAVLPIHPRIRVLRKRAAHRAAAVAAVLPLQPLPQ